MLLCRIVVRNSSGLRWRRVTNFPGKHQVMPNQILEKRKMKLVKQTALTKTGKQYSIWPNRYGIQQITIISMAGFFLEITLSVSLSRLFELSGSMECFLFSSCSWIAFPLLQDFATLYLHVSHTARLSLSKSSTPTTIVLTLWIHCTEDELKLHFGLAR